MKGAWCCAWCISYDDVSTGGKKKGGGEACEGQLMVSGYSLVLSLGSRVEPKLKLKLKLNPLISIARS